MLQRRADLARTELTKAAQLFVEEQKHFESAIASTQLGLCDFQVWKDNSEDI